MIVRAPSRRRWTTISNTSVNDSTLSYRAIGLLVYVLSKPDNWRVSVGLLCSQHSEGREAVRAALHELEGAGYIKRERTHDGETGKWEWECWVYEEPIAQKPVNGSDQEEQGITAGQPIPQETVDGKLGDKSFKTEGVKTQSSSPPAAVGTASTATRREDDERIMREAKRRLDDRERALGPVANRDLWLTKCAQGISLDEIPIEPKQRYELAERRRSAPCLECEGTGWVGDEPVRQCPACEGSGIRPSEASIAPLRTMTAAEGIQRLRERMSGLSGQHGVADATECVG